MSNRDNFQWRPNDNSSVTRIRYDLEAQHWLRSFKSASASSQPANWGQTFFVIGLVISFAANLIWLILICITDLIVWIRNKLQARVELRESKKRDEELQRIAKEIKVKEDFKKHQQVKDDLKKKMSVINIADKFKYDKFFKKAAKKAVIEQKVSISELMFDLGVEFDRVCNLIDQLIRSGVISKLGKNSSRKVFINDETTLNILFEILEEQNQL